MSVPLLDLRAQYAAIKDEVLQAVLGVVEAQTFIMGEAVARFEKALATACDTGHAVGCASGTDALYLPLKALQLAPGDQVITTPFTFFATAGAVHNAGGSPVFVDIEPSSFNLDVAQLEAATGPRTRAIIPVHLFGQMAEMERVVEVARKRDLFVLEDAAQAIGARRQIGSTWRTAGSIGQAGALSFFPSKNLGAWGDGGAVITHDAALATRLRLLRTHGGAKQYHHDEVGINSRLDTLQAAVLLAKLPHLSGWSAARRQKAAFYSEALAGIDGVTPPATTPGNEHIFHQYTIRARRRDGLKARLQESGIGCAVYYPTPLHLQPCFAHLGYRSGQFPESERAAAEVLSLPVYPELTTAQQEQVVDAVRGYYQ